MSAERRITFVSLWTNVALTALKFAAGLFGHSQAMIADAVHSLSDFATDLAVLIGLRFSSKPRDDDHAYGHGKYETIAAAIVGLALGYVALRIAGDAITRIFSAVNGNSIPTPSIYAFWAAVVSIGVKEVLFQVTRRVAQATGSASVMANAWHHRSDALSSLATAGGVGAAALLGENWRILDPIAALFVSLFLLRVGWRIIREQLGDLTDQNLDPAICEEILKMAQGIEGIVEPHNLRTRMVGRHPVIDLHIRMREDMPLKEAHDLATSLEHALQDRFGKETIANLHLEPYSA
jgi:cation diffusion facilitator family transporter